MWRTIRACWAWHHAYPITLQHPAGLSSQCLPVVQQNVRLPNEIVGKSHIGHTWIFWLIPLEVIIIPVLRETQNIMYSHIAHTYKLASSLWKNLSGSWTLVCLCGCSYSEIIMNVWQQLWRTLCSESLSQVSVMLGRKTMFIFAGNSSNSVKCRVLDLIWRQSDTTHKSATGLNSCWSTHPRWLVPWLPCSRLQWWGIYLQPAALWWQLASMSALSPS